MPKVNMHEAKTHLSRLVERALQGEEIVLAKNGRALVRLVPVDLPLEQRPIGLHATPLSDEEAQEAMRALSVEELTLVSGDPGVAGFSEVTVVW